MVGYVKREFVGLRDAIAGKYVTVTDMHTCADPDVGRRGLCHDNYGYAIGEVVTDKAASDGEEIEVKETDSTAGRGGKERGESSD